MQPGVEINATFRPLVDGGEVLGAIGELDPNAVSTASDAAVGAAPRRLGGRLGELVGGCCRSWLHTLDLLERVAGSHEPILLIGEAGSGKLHLARAVHQLAGRATTLSVFDAALAQVDGAGVWLRRVKQKFDVPGTLVLRHLEALDQRTALALSSLLEGLEDRSSDRPQVIGLYTCNDADHHLTNTGPHVDRIGVHRVVVPPLRERSADIPDLVKAIATGLGHTNIAVSSDALQALMRSPWPGNIRQLALLVRTAVAGRTCGTIGLADLPTEVIEGKVTTFTGFEKAEYHAIVQALRFAAGNKKVAAEELGIARSTLYRKLRTYCIDLDRTTF
jgi:hypothetical protein